MDKEEKKPIFLPKDTEGKLKNIQSLHILGLVLMIALIILLGSSVGILIRNVFSLLMAAEGGSGIDVNMFADMIEFLGFGSADLIVRIVDGFKVLSKIFSVGGLVIGLVATIIIVILMKHRIDDYNDDSMPLENPVRIKKTKYVWLGFLLGAYGIHLFAVNRKRAIVFLILGGVGTIMFPPLVIYTLGVSFADALLACYIDKDSEGYIVIENYSYWI